MQKSFIATVAAVLTFVAWVQAAPLPVASVVATAEQSPHVAANTLDGNLGTRWSAHGLGQTITYTLEACGIVDAVKVAFYRGDQDQNFFDVEISEDGTTWTEVFSGASSGTALALESYDIADANACFVRITGMGNTNSNAKTALWTSITEVSIEAPPVETIPVPLSALEAICAPLLAQ